MTAWTSPAPHKQLQQRRCLQLLWPVSVARRPSCCCMRRQTAALYTNRHMTLSLPYSSMSCAYVSNSSSLSASVSSAAIAARPAVLAKPSP